MVEIIDSKLFEGLKLIKIDTSPSSDSGSGGTVTKSYTIKANTVSDYLVVIANVGVKAKPWSGTIIEFYADASIQLGSVNRHIRAGSHTFSTKITNQNTDSLIEMTSAVMATFTKNDVDFSQDNTLTVKVEYDDVTD